MSLEILFKAVQEACSPGLWSQGVTLTRGENTFLKTHESPQEIGIRIRLKNQAVSPKVTLWPEDLDWDCDCGSPAMPCPHIVASVIQLKRAAVIDASENSSAHSASEHTELHYIFRRLATGLRLERWLVRGADQKQLDISLTSYNAGLQNGRIHGPTIAATKADYNVDAALGAQKMATLDRAAFERLWKAFEPDQKVFLENTKVQFSTQMISVKAECIDEINGYRLRKVKNALVTETFPHGLALCRDTFHLIAPTLLSPEEKAWIQGDGSYWPPEKEQLLRTQIIPALQKKIPVEVNSVKLPQMIDLPPRLQLHLEKEMANGESYLSVLANVVYGDPPLAQLDNATLQLNAVKERASAKITQLVKRDVQAERSLIQRLSAELNIQPGRRISFYGQNALDFAKKAQAFAPLGNGGDAFVPVQNLTPQFKTDDGIFDVQFALASSSGTQAHASFEKVFRAWQQNEDAVPLLDGNWAKIPKDWLARFGKKVRELLASRDADLKVPAHSLFELATLCEESGETYSNSLKNLRENLDNFRGIQNYPLPADLQAELRDYQRRGFNWLQFLRQSQLGALLADDMGLGKTLQTLCTFNGKTLVIAPTSVLFNWAQEIKKFRPGLKLGMYYGNKRELDPHADVILTSYGVLRLDQEELKKTKWEAVVIDEAQTIKNPDSQIARAVFQMPAKFRIALSGTPVENRLSDLWSQFNFINPGLLGSLDDFQEKFARPIARGDQEAAQKLRSRIKPFILRRLKREVAPELPPRTETVLYCELSPDEKNLYEAILSATRQEVIETLESGGNIMKALEVILRLRQACCHSALVPGQQALESSKLNLLLESLEESLSEGHKSLVFSQWTSFLDLIAAELKKKNIPFSRIDGSTQQRQKIVNEFQSTDGPPVMLISLKAGGVGLNLTAADHIFIMDPWWNPAVEDQAADRAHRIGQLNPVIIHRLVARESVEERILLLQEKKKDLAKAVLEGADISVDLTRKDLLELLR